MKMKINKKQNRHNQFSEGNLHSGYDFRRNRNKKKIFYWSIFFIVLLFLFANYKDNIFTKVQSIKSGELNITLERNELVIEQEILELVNQERAKYSIHSLKISNRLNKLAKQHSIKMMEENFFEHSNNNVGENVIEIPIHCWVEGCGLTYTNNQIAKCMVSSWVSSPLHHQNMVDVSYSITGIGVSCDFFMCKGTQNFL